MLVGFEVGVGAAKDLEDGLLIAAAEDGADSVLTLDEDYEDRHRVFLDGGADAWYGGIVGLEALVRGRVVVDRSWATISSEVCKSARLRTQSCDLI